MAGNSVCYASPNDLAMLGLPDNLLSKVDAPTIQRHLEIASGVIDSYLRAAIPDRIARETCRSCIGTLRDSRRRSVLKSVADYMRV